MPAWQAASDQGEVFRAFLEQRPKIALPPSTAKPRETIARSNTLAEAAPAAPTMTGELPRDQKAPMEEGLRMTGEGLKKSITNWLYQIVTLWILLRRL